MSHNSISGLACLLFAWAAFASTQAADSTGLKFSAGTSNEFTFDTGILRGKLRAGGKSSGLSSVIHVPTGTRLDASMGLFSHYRLFTANHRYGTAGWDIASEARLEGDGSVHVRWPAAPDRPFELTAVYRWAAPDVLDLETGVSAQADLQKFESFLASYFTPSFSNCSVCIKAGREPRFFPAEKTAGTWLAFPREDQAISIIQDGRWKIEPNPVDWAILPKLAEPLAFRRSPSAELTAIIMSPVSDCFAVLTPHQTEPHYSLYLCLFGRDLKTGEQARVRSRLVLAANPSDAEILRLYRAYNSR